MDPVKRFVLNENKFNDDFTKYTEKIACQIVNNRDKQLFGAIINYAKQTGITDLFVVDEEFVKTALLNEVERRKRVSHSTPIADVVEVKHGYWYEIDSDVGWESVGCSVCTKEYHLCDDEERPNFCPYCGAKMDGGKQ